MVSQREEFLQSLRFHEMKKRYNELGGHEEVSFDRVFASYESVNSKEGAAGINKETLESSGSDGSSDDTSITFLEDDRDIYLTWSTFKQWLTTSHPLFCIQGKPGSGKSTLSKFIIDNPNTKSLLTQWNPQPTILSHFLWKIGAATQNSIKGLLCSLIYQLLASDRPLQEQVMAHQIRTSYKYYDDWSSRDLKNVFRYVAETQHYQIFIFIDGMDEIGHSDGVPNLIQVIEELLSFPQIKICVSSRPDLSVTEWLKKHNANHIFLEDLTRPEMAQFSPRELGSFVSSAKISMVASKHFTRIIVKRSKGVFLWVYLVLISVTIGIRNSDSEEVLLQRLEALPSELENPYTEMWRRMGENSHVYQNVAASNLQSNIVVRWYYKLFVQKTQEFLRGPKNDEEYKVLEEVYKETKDRIEHKCGGLLQICAQPTPPNANSEVSAAEVWHHEVEFIHHTAHDFLIDTEKEQKIMKLHTKSIEETCVALLRALLVAGCIHFYKHEGRASVSSVLKQLYGLYECLEPCQEIQKQELIKLAPVIKRLYENGVVGLLVSWRPKREFLSLLAPYPCFHVFIISELSEMLSLIPAATQTLQATCKIKVTVFRREAIRRIVRNLGTTYRARHVGDLS
ncbi:hypothetical protein FDENT_10953 [Fusarium denticulatum]|uniref:NACHT domain-containing protein n=1 Tax=Fusarium denticulatum TaxID=48507 RepID=A0A8H5WV08_9HYPO|nr:hypothetical protein FDENT_10953 [Fusarium denticulatum]